MEYPPVSLCRGICRCGRVKLRRFPRKRHGANHELIEEWNGKCRIAVCGTIDHSFLDELAADRGARLNADLEQVCNIAGAVGAGA